MATNETQLAAGIVRDIKREFPGAVWVFKVVGHPRQMVGVPDLLLCVEGLLVGLEVKHRKPGESEEHARGRATATQAAQIEKIRQAGGIAGVVLSSEEALALVRSALD